MLHLKLNNAGSGRIAHAILSNISISRSVLFKLTRLAILLRGCLEGDNWGLGLDGLWSEEYELCSETDSLSSEGEALFPGRGGQDAGLDGLWFEGYDLCSEREGPCSGRNGLGLDSLCSVEYDLHSV